MGCVVWEMTLRLKLRTCTKFIEEETALRIIVFVSYSQSYDVPPPPIFSSLPFTSVHIASLFFQFNSLRPSFTVLVHPVHPPRNPKANYFNTQTGPDRGFYQMQRDRQFRGGWPRTPVPAGQSGLIYCSCISERSLGRPGNYLASTILMRTQARGQVVGTSVCNCA
jgi:hypothetical protein